MDTLLEKGTTFYRFLLRSLLLLTGMSACGAMVPGGAAYAAGDTAAAKSSPRFAIVLSGGGARGLSQIGALQALDEAHLRPDLVVGTSMGAIVGALYAAGFSPDSILRIARSINWNSLFANAATRNQLFVSQKSEQVNYLFELRFTDKLEPVAPSSISHGQAIFDLLAPLLAPAEFRAHMNFDSLPIPLRIVSTDLLSGRRVVITNGNLVSAVRASSGIPLAFSPVVKDSMLLMDGGIVANIPISVARDAGASFVLALDVTSPLWKRQDLDNPVRLMDQVVQISVKRQKEGEKSKADLVVAPQLSGFSNTDFGKIDSLVKLGYVSMKSAIDVLKRQFGADDRGRRVPPPVIEWKNTDPALSSKLDTTGGVAAEPAPNSSLRSLLERKLDAAGYRFGSIAILDQNGSKATVQADPGVIKGVDIFGNPKTRPRLIRTAAGLLPGDTLSVSQLQKAMASLYATDLFNNVNIDMDTAQRVRIMVDEKRYWRVRMGLRYDEFHLGEGYLQPAYENLFGSGVCAQLHLQYGLRREKYELEFQSNHLFSANFANSAKLQTYISTERIYTEDTTGQSSIPADSIRDRFYIEKTLQKSGILGIVGIQVGRSAMLASGLHFEFYRVNSSTPNVFKDIGGLKYLPYALLRLTMDSMDKFPFPKDGLKTYISIGGTGTAIGGNENFFKADASLSRIGTIDKRHTLTGELRVAWSSSPLPEVEQAYLGGAFSEKTLQDMEVSKYVPFVGMAERALRGDILMLAHLDYRFRIGRLFYLTASSDWGSVWKQPDFSWDRAFTDFVKRAPFGFGIGFAIETPVGPLQGTYGRLAKSLPGKGIIASDQFYISAGYDF
jgi:predicted acylesterase/phospholipase RssA/outer membrane translocation and assembly module TamA